MSRPQAICVYCGKPGRTKEHLWGKWSIKHFPSFHKSSVHKVVRYPHVTGFPLPLHLKGALTRQGPTRSLTIKAPCERCNTGWMKGITDRNISILKKLGMD